MKKDIEGNIYDFEAYDFRSVYHKQQYDKYVQDYHFMLQNDKDTKEILKMIQIEKDKMELNKKLSENKPAVYIDFSWLTK